MTSRKPRMQNKVSRVYQRLVLRGVLLMFVSLCIIALRAHLLHNMQAATTAAKPVSSPPDQRGPVASHDDNLNIDPAISGVGVNHQQPPQGISQHPPHPQQLQQPQQNIQIQGTTPEMQSHSPEGEGSSETPKRGGKRELSTSKRAAQNRAAQVNPIAPTSRASA